MTSRTRTERAPRHRAASGCACTALAVLACLLIAPEASAQEQRRGETPFAESAAEPATRAPRDVMFEEWRDQEFATPDLTWRTAGGSLWSTGAGPAGLELRLDGWSQQVEDDPFCLNAGYTGCHDALGGRLALQARLELTAHLELRLHVGASAATDSMAADAGAMLVWWFTRELGLAIGVTYLQPLPGTPRNSALPAMLDFDRAFTHETPYDIADNPTTGQWIGGLGILSR